MGKLQVIVGGQAGSEGKGAVCAALATPEQAPENICAVRVAGPNAGHSAVATDGTKWALRQIPVAAVVNPGALLHIAAGSEVDITVLLDETKRLEDAGISIRDRLTIDPMATILEPRHIEQENARQISGRIGSTSKGIGAARADRIWREAALVRDTDLADSYNIEPVAPLLLSALRWGTKVQIEGTQGHWLGLHHEFYPQVTSSNTRAIDFAAMAGVNPWDAAVTEFEVWVVFRSRPIRVAGASGPLPGETTWDELGLEREYTTVTKKLRRVGSWDAHRAAAAIQDNGGAPVVSAALTMVDHEFPEVAGLTGTHANLESAIPSVSAVEWLHDRQREIGAPIRYVGTGPATAISIGY